MPWQCRLVDRETQRAKGECLRPGDMWFAPAMLQHEFSLKFGLSAEYHRDWFGKRPPIFVMLPCGSWFCVDGAAHEDGSPTLPVHGQGWTVTGEAPRITVSPSINAVGRYHGWLLDGVLSDDCEGRAFPTQKDVDA